MKYLILTIMMMPAVNVLAHCPNALEADGEKFCYTVEWLNGEKRKGKNFIEVKELSPYLNAVNEIPQKRVFSKLIFKIWIDGDKKHVFAAPEGFSVKPYMLKSLDHADHGVAYESEFIEAGQALLVSKMPLISMRGCWNLVWEKDDGEIISLAESFEYPNLSMGDQMERMNFCSMCSTDPKPPGDDHDDDGHGDHH